MYKFYDKIELKLVKKKISTPQYRTKESHQTGNLGIDGQNKNRIEEKTEENKNQNRT